MVERRKLSVFEKPLDHPLKDVKNEDENKDDR